MNIWTIFEIWQLNLQRVDPVKPVPKDKKKYLTRVAEEGLVPVRVDFNREDLRKLDELVRVLVRNVYLGLV